MSLLASLAATNEQNNSLQCTYYNHYTLESVYCNLGPVDRAPVFGSRYRGLAKQLKKSNLARFRRIVRWNI